MRILFVGFSRGIGRHLAEVLLADGHELWGISRNVASWNHENLRATCCDVSNWQSLSECAASISTQWPSIDALICCSGIHGAVGPAMELDPKEWASTIHGNLNAAFFTIRAFFGLLRSSPIRSKVLCFSGGGATGPRAHFSAYGVAKSGIVRLVETLNEEWKDLPIDINSIAPGAIKTRLTEEIIRLGPSLVGKGEYEDALQVMKTGGASLEKVTGLVKFLLSEESNGISGKLLAAQWDPWQFPDQLKLHLKNSDAYTLRRMTPKD